MHLAKTPQRDRAAAIVPLEDETPAEALEAIQNHPNIISVQQVRP